MRYLLDTHTFLWWIADDRKLSAHAREVIADSDNDIVFSAVSAWEIAIKYAIGRLSLDHPPKRFVRDQLKKTGFPVLDVRLDHALEVSELPQIHSDPFDRLLIAQCRCDSMPLISSDKTISQYPVELIW